jgi:hypothetical protein
MLSVSLYLLLEDENICLDILQFHIPLQIHRDFLKSYDGGARLKYPEAVMEV